VGKGPVVVDVRGSIGGDVADAAPSTALFTGPGAIAKPVSRKLVLAPLEASGERVWTGKTVVLMDEATGGAEEVANDRLGETIKDSIKTVVTQRTLQQVVMAERAEFTGSMMKNARPAAETMGVDLVDVRITKIDLPQQVQDSVFERMRATFKAKAAKSRAEGVESSERTRADANKQQTEILADAAKQAGQIRGQGDASASEVYAKAYSKNAEFYSFYRSMQSYRQAIGTQGDMLVIAPDNAYFKYFNKSQPPPPPR